MNSTTSLIKELRQETGASYLDCKQALLSQIGAYEQAVTFLHQMNLNKATKKADRETADGLIVVKNNADTICIVTLNCETDFVALTSDFKRFTHHLADLVLHDLTLTDATKLATAVSPATPNQTVYEAMQALIGKLGENITLGRVARYVATDDTIVHGYVHTGALSGYGENEGRLGILVELGLADKTAVSDTVGQAIAHDLALHIASAAPIYVSPENIPADVLAEKQGQLWAQVRTENKPETIKEKIVAGRLNKYYVQKCLLVQPFVKDDTLTVAEWLAAKSTESGTAVSDIQFTRAAITI